MKILNKIKVNQNFNDLSLNNDTIYLDEHKFLLKVNNKENTSIIIYDIDDSDKFELVELQSNLTNNMIVELETKQIKLFTIL